MALFEKIMIPFSIRKYQGEYLILRVSKYDMVKAPFDATISVDKSSCKLTCENFELYISNITPSVKDGEVKAGDYIGTPMTIGGQTYISVKLVKNEELQDMVKYLNFRDKTFIPKVIDEPEEVQEEEPKKTSTKRKSTKKTK